MAERQVRISVGLRLDLHEMKEFDARNAKVSEILTEQGGTFERRVTPKEKYTEIEYRASIPASQARGHHNFDSRLNKSWPEGAGAGWVEEI
ncbi:MAG TPA: hypothetical protein VN174_01260 [Candidatus Methanoperedens sp.]|nr:hypothetical protein [Candidatus Methanoperedens sp.]